MSQLYSTYEAKAKFSEILRKVRAGQRVLISFRGQAVAEVRPLEQKSSFEHRLQQLESAGALGPPARHQGKLRPVAKRTGALQRFLESRD